MNQKSNVLKKKDFEQYEVILPFSSMFGKRKKQFLCSELEKMHPCFSDEFAFDNDLKSLSRKGVFEKIFVISKSKLAEYESRRSFSGTGFWIENERKGKRFFVNPKIKLTALSLTGCLFVALAAGISGALAGKAVQKEKEEIPVVPVQSDVKKSEADISPYQIFEIVANAKGKINRFEWKRDGYIQRMEASVAGVYPEDFSSVGFVSDTVVYKNSVPEMKVSIEKKIPGSNEIDNSEQMVFVQRSESFVQGIRSGIIDAGGILQKEICRTNQSYQVEFICETGTKGKNLFKFLYDFINEYKKNVTYVSVSRSDNFRLHIDLIIEELPLTYEGLILNQLSENLNLFFDEIKTDGQKTHSLLADKQNITNQTATTKKTNHIKIGEIKKNGKTVIFYKNPDGKMEVE